MPRICVRLTDRQYDFVVKVRRIIGAGSDADVLRFLIQFTMAQMEGGSVVFLPVPRGAVEGKGARG